MGPYLIQCQGHDNSLLVQLLTEGNTEPYLEENTHTGRHVHTQYNSCWKNRLCTYLPCCIFLTVLIMITDRAVALIMSFHTSVEKADSFAFCQQFHRNNNNKRIHAQGSKYCSVVGTIAPMPGEPHATDMIILYVEGQSTPIFFLKGKTKQEQKTHKTKPITDHLTHKIT